MEYSFNTEKIKKKIRKAKAKNVLIQLPDGLKPDYERVIKELKGDYNLILWGGTCFGACDTPNVPEQAGVDLIIQLGHEES
jgi:2-(3-amino-3-carboxypropyl)histidine synthase